MIAPAELERRLLVLIDRLEPRLVVKAAYLLERVENMREETRAGEPGVGLHSLCANVYESDVLLDADEITEIEALARAMQLPEREWLFVHELGRE